MENNLILFSSVTAAMRAREILKKYGVFGRIVRTPIGINNKSCGYSVFVNDNFARALEILSGNGIGYIGTAAVGAK